MKVKKIIASVILIALFMMQFNFITGIYPVFAETGKEDKVQIENNHYRYYYEQLSSQAKVIYDVMYKMYSSGDLKTGNTNYDLTVHGEVSQDTMKKYARR